MASTTATDIPRRSDRIANRPQPAAVPEPPQAPERRQPKPRSYRDIAEILGGTEAARWEREPQGVLPLLEEYDPAQQDRSCLWKFSSGLPEGRIRIEATGKGTTGIDWVGASCLTKMKTFNESQPGDEDSHAQRTGLLRIRHKPNLVNIMLGPLHEFATGVPVPDEVVAAATRRPQNFEAVHAAYDEVTLQIFALFLMAETVNAMAKVLGFRGRWAHGTAVTSMRTSENTSEIIDHKHVSDWHLVNAAAPSCSEWKTPASWDGPGMASFVQSHKGCTDVFFFTTWGPRRNGKEGWSDFTPEVDGREVNPAEAHLLLIIAQVYIYMVIHRIEWARLENGRDWVLFHRPSPYTNEIQISDVYEMNAPKCSWALCSLGILARCETKVWPKHRTRPATPFGVQVVKRSTPERWPSRIPYSHPGLERVEPLMDEL